MNIFNDDMRGTGQARNPLFWAARFLKKFFPQKQSDRLSEISMLQFEITNDCNLHCNICWRALRGREFPVKNLTFDKFKIIMDKALSAFPGIRNVNTQGLGEPTLCPDFLRILEDVKRRELTAWFVTNGTLIDEDRARRLVEIGVDKIRFSIDSADPEVYAAIKCGSSLKTVAQNIGRLNDYKKQFKKEVPAIAFNSVVLRKNHSTINKLIEMAFDNQVGEISLLPLVSFSKGLSVAGEQVDFYEDSFQESFDGFKKEAKSKGIDLNLGISLESKESRFCNFGFYIDADCFVHPCCNVSSMNFGNIFNQDIKVIVRKYLRFRKWIDRKTISCKECNRILDK